MIELIRRSPRAMRMLDRLVFFAGVFGPLMNLPQIMQTLVTKDAGGVSALSWTMYALYDIPWIIYGLVREDRRIVTAYSLWFLSNVLVLIGVVLY